MGKILKIIFFILIVWVIILGWLFAGMVGLLGPAVQDSLYAVQLIPIEIRFILFMIIAWVTIWIAKSVFN